MRKKKVILLVAVVGSSFCACAPVPQKTIVQEPSRVQLEELKYQHEIVQDYLNFLHQAKQIMHVRRGKKYEDGQ